MPSTLYTRAEIQSEDGALAASGVSDRPLAGRMPGYPEVMRKRAQFLAAAKARRHGTPGFLLQARNRGDELPARVGFTCSKKIGNAVMRNRAKRRLRAVAQQCLPAAARPGWDYVLVGRPELTISRKFTDLIDDLANALQKVHK